MQNNTWGSHPRDCSSHRCKSPLPLFKQLQQTSVSQYWVSKTDWSKRCLKNSRCCLADLRPVSCLISTAHVQLSTEASRVNYSPCMCVFVSEYCMEHWKEDWFFGYQCMNGSNPRMIKRCKKLPENFPVTPNMVQSSMAPRTDLDKELKVDDCSSSICTI